MPNRTLLQCSRIFIYIYIYICMCHNVTICNWLHHFVGCVSSHSDSESREGARASTYTRARLRFQVGCHRATGGEQPLMHSRRLLLGCSKSGFVCVVEQTNTNLASASSFTKQLPLLSSQDRDGSFCMRECNSLLCHYQRVDSKRKGQ